MEALKLLKEELCNLYSSQCIMVMKDREFLC